MHTPMKYDTNSQYPGTPDPGSYEKYDIIPDQSIPRWTDSFWIPLFSCLLAGFIVICAVDLRDYVGTLCYQFPPPSDIIPLFNLHTLVVISACSIGAIILSAIYFTVAAVLPQSFIVITMILQIIVTMATAIFYLVERDWLPGTVSLLWLVFTSLVYWMLREKIPYATLSLSKAMEIAKNYQAIILISSIGSIFPAGFSLLLAFVVMASYGKMLDSRCVLSGRYRSSEEFIGLFIYVVFTGYMINEIFKAIVRTTVCSIYGWWFYNKDPPKFPIVGGLARALTCSFGTLCMAAFWLACSNLVCQGLTILAGYMLKSNLEVSLIIVAWLMCQITTIFDWLLAHFTNYIYVHVALYNHSYSQAAYNSLLLIRTNGYKALINDCLAGGVLTFGTWSIGSITGIICYIYLRFISPFPTEGSAYIVAYVMIMAMQIGNLFNTSILSGVQTLFVAFVRDSDQLKETRKETYDQLNAYHQFVPYVFAEGSI